MFSPAYDVYDNGTLVAGPDTNAQWCPAGGTCQPANLGGGFAQGDTVTQEIYYARTAGLVEIAESDAAGNKFTASYPVGANVSFGTARVEAGYGTWVKPLQKQQIVWPGKIAVTSASGKRGTISSGPWTYSQEIATSTGLSTGTVQAAPTTLNRSGNSFAVDFVP